MKTKLPPSMAILLIAVITTMACSLPFLATEQATPTISVDLSSPPEEGGEDTGPLDCQHNLDCFIQAAQQCQVSSVTFVFPLDFMGALITSTTALNIEGPDMGQCVFHITTERVDVSYSDDIIQQMKDNGMSDDDIEVQRQMMEDASMQTGYDDTCRGSEDDLVSLLTNWQAGNISTDDWLPFSCEGKVFSGEIAEIPIITEEAQPTEGPTAPSVEQPEDGNLINNPSFEENPVTTATTWEVETRGTNLAAQWSSMQSKIGDYSLELYASAKGNQGWPGWFTTDLIPIEEGSQYVFRAWAITADGADAWVSIDLFDTSGQKTTSVTSGCIDIPVDTWTAAQVVVLPERTEGITHVRLGMQQCLASTEGNVTHLFYDEVFFGLIQDFPQ